MLSLVVLPYAGASGLAYREWATLLEPDVRLRPFTPPGRGERAAEPLITELDELVDEVVAHLEDEQVVFGHSMGALVAYEVARRAAARPGSGKIKGLIVSGLDAPHELRSSDGRARHELSDEALIEVLRRYGGTPEELLRRDDVVRYFLPPLRADLRMVDTYVHRVGEALSVPLVCYRAADDGGTSVRGTEAWAERTSDRFRLREFPGGHFYLHDAAAVCDAVRHDLAWIG